jgi:acyl carrier protein
MILERLKRIIGELMCYDEDTITSESRFNEDLNMDDVDIFQLIMYIEDEFDIETDSEDLEDITTVAEAVEKITELLS